MSDQADEAQKESVAAPTPEFAIGDLVHHLVSFFPKKLKASADHQTVKGVPSSHGFQRGICSSAERLVLVAFLEGDMVWHVNTTFQEYEVTAVKHIWTRREVRWKEVDAGSGELKECFGVEDVGARLVYDIVAQNGEVAKGVEGIQLTMAVKGTKWPAGVAS